MQFIFFLLSLKICSLSPQPPTADSKSKPTTYTFTTDDSLLHTLTDNLLTKKNGFIAELVSNSLDAIKKTNTAKPGEIIVKITDNKFILRDNGIGMDHSDIVKFIGVIGSSSSRDNVDMIGRFGIGFYSVFKYADKVEVLSRKENMKEGVKAFFERENRKFVVHDNVDVDFYGTEIVAHLNSETAILEKDLEEWVKINMIPAGDNNSIVLVKSEESLEMERAHVKEAYEKKKEEIEKQRKEKEDAKLKALEEKKKQAEDNEANEDKVNEDNEEKVNEVTEDVPESDVLEDLEVMLSKIEKTKKLEFAPWTNLDDFDKLKSIYTERYKTGTLKYAQKFTFYAQQKKNNNKDVNTRFDAIIFIPELDKNREPVQGKVEIFISGTKIEDLNFKLPSSLNFISAIIKSNEALITSTREGFYDSENTCRCIVNAIQNKIRDILISKPDEEIHAYDKIIKKVYIENMQLNNKTVSDKYASLITFETNTTIKSIHKLAMEIHENNKILKETTGKELKDLYFTNTLISLVKETDNPLFDGITHPYIFLNDIHDEEIVRLLKTYDNLNLVNINTVKFENKTVSKEQEEEFKSVIAEIKRVLNPYISDVYISKRLVNVPFSIVPTQNSMSSSYKSVIGENDLERHPFRQFIDPKPTLEVNLDSKEIIALIDNMSEIAIFKMFLSASMAVRVDVYSKAACVNTLMNSAREDLGIEKVVYNEKKQDDSMDWMNKMPKGGEEELMDDEENNEEDMENEKNNEEFNEDVIPENNDEPEIEDIKKEEEDCEHGAECTGHENEVSDENSDDVLDLNDQDAEDDQNVDNENFGDKFKDMFNPDKMKEMQEMFKDDSFLKDMMTPDKMKEMEAFIKSDKMKDLMKDESIQEMMKQEKKKDLYEKKGSEYAREEL